MAADTLAAIANAPSPQATPSPPGADPSAGDPFAALVYEASQDPIGSGKTSDFKAISAFLARDESPAGATGIDPLLLDQMAAALVAPAPVIAPDWQTTTELESAPGHSVEPGAGTAVPSIGSATAKASVPATEPHPTLGSLVPSLAAMTSELSVSSGPVPVTTLGSLVPSLAAATADLPGLSGPLPATVPDHSAPSGLPTPPANFAGVDPTLPSTASSAKSQRPTGLVSSDVEAVPSAADGLAGELSADAGQMERTMVGMLHPFLKEAVFIQCAARGCRHLNEGKATHTLRVFLQHAFDSVQSFNNAFGVVKAVYANGQPMIRCEAVGCKYLTAAMVDSAPCLTFGGLWPRNGDGVAFDKSLFTPKADGGVFVLDARF